MGGFIPQPPVFDWKDWDAVLLGATQRHPANGLRTTERRDHISER